MEFTSSFSRFKNSLPKVPYSTLTIYDKVWMVYNACMDITENMLRGELKDQMNEKWYEVVLRTIKDLGFDITPLRMEFVDWNDLENVSYIYTEINHKICDRFDVHNQDLYSNVYIEQIVM